MVKQPAMESSEFTMSHEDFPALPGSAPNSGAGGGGGGGANGQNAPINVRSLGENLGGFGADSPMDSNRALANAQNAMSDGASLVAQMAAQVSAERAAAAAAAAAGGGGGGGLGGQIMGAPGMEQRRNGIQTSADGKDAFSFEQSDREPAYRKVFERKFIKLDLDTRSGNHREARGRLVTKGTRFFQTFCANFDCRIRVRIYRSMLK